MWTVNFQLVKLALEKAEEPEIKLLTLVGSQRKQGDSWKTYTSVSLTTWKPLTVWITTNAGNSSRYGNTRRSYLSSEKSVCGSRNKTVRTGHGTMGWFQIGKGIRQGCILSPCLFNLCAEYIMRNAGQEEAQAGIKVAGRNINNFRYADDTTLMAESEEELKSLLMTVREEWKVGLKLNIQKTKIMASGPITSWK